MCIAPSDLHQTSRTMKTLTTTKSTPIGTILLTASNPVEAFIVVDIESTKVDSNTSRLSGWEVNYSPTTWRTYVLQTCPLPPSGSFDAIRPIHMGSDTDWELFGSLRSTSEWV
jgi:hypothetical protein